MNDLVEAVKTHALDHYTDGWDEIVECFTDEEIAEAIGKARTVKGAIAKMAVIVKIRNERRREVQSTIW